MDSLSRNANFEENRLTEFTCLNFIYFPSLQILNLNGNNIKQISLTDCVEISENIPEVTQLHLSENSMENIPEVAFQFAKLTYLDLSKNKIKEISLDSCCKIEAWLQLRLGSQWSYDFRKKKDGNPTNETSTYLTIAFPNYR